MKKLAADSLKFPASIEVEFDQHPNQHEGQPLFQVVLIQSRGL
jgi:hypothetical protein